MPRILVQELFTRSGDLTGSGNPSSGNGYARPPATHSGFSSRVSRWVSDGDKLSPTQQRTPGIGTTGNSPGHDFLGQCYTPQVAALEAPLYATSGASLYGGDVPTTFEVEIALTINTPEQWPANGANPLNDYFAVGMMFFLPVSGVFTDWDPAYLYYFNRTPANAQELRGEWMESQWDDIAPDTVGLQVTGEAGRFHVFGAANSLELRGNTSAMQLKAVFHSVPSGNTNAFGMRMYVDQTLIYSHFFGRPFLQTVGVISAGQPAIEALRRRIGFWAYVNGETRQESLTGYGGATPAALAKIHWPKFDAFIVRDLLADAEPAVFPTPTLTSRSVKTTASLTGEGAASQVLTIQPSFAEETSHQMLVAGHAYQTGHEATFPLGAENRRQWAMRWDVLTSGQRSTLRAFVASSYGQSLAFTWSHPTTGETIKAHFLSDVSFTQTGPAQYQAEATVEELF